MCVLKYLFVCVWVCMPTQQFTISPTNNSPLKVITNLHPLSPFPSSSPRPFIPLIQRAHFFRLTFFWFKAICWFRKASIKITTPFSESEQTWIRKEKYKEKGRLKKQPLLVVITVREPNEGYIWLTILLIWFPPHTRNWYIMVIRLQRCFSTTNG